VLAPFLKSLHETDASFSAAMGLVLRPARNRLDMMPPVLKERVRQKTRWRAGLRCLVVCYCFVWAVFLPSWFAVVRHAQAAAVCLVAWQAAQPDVECFSAAAGSAAFQREVWGTAGVSALLEEIFRNMPATTVLTQMKAERGVFSFSGLAPDAATVLALHRALASSGFFADVLLDFIGQGLANEVQQDAHEEGQRFSMRCAVKQ